MDKGCHIKVHLEGDLLCEFDSTAKTWDEAHEEAMFKVLDEIEWTYDVEWPEDTKRKEEQSHEEGGRG